MVDVEKLKEAISGPDGLMVRSAVLEDKVDTLVDKVDTVGDKLDAHIQASGVQIAAFGVKVDTLVTALGGGAKPSSDSATVSGAILGTIRPSNAYTIGLAIAGIIAGLAGIGGISAAKVMNHQTTPAAEAPVVTPGDP